MAHKRKKRRTQQPGADVNARAAGVNKQAPGQRVPKSMVIRMGGSDVGTAVSQLVKDMRHVMEPHTASRLKERRGNKLRDFTTMAGPLGVSHLLLFYRAPKTGNVNMKLVVTPRGPTFSFHVEKYSLSKDVARSLRRPKSGSAATDHFQPPLLVMNNFASSSEHANGDNGEANSVPKHLETLTTSVFQSLFPPISPQNTPLSSIRRVLLVNRENSRGSETGAFTLNLRHYAITSKSIEPLSKGMRRLQTAQRRAIRRPTDKPGPDFAAGEPNLKQAARAHRGGLPNMAHLDDVADYLLEPGAAGGYTSASESEMDMTDAEVEVLESQTRRVLNRKERERRKQEARFEAQRAAHANQDNKDESADEDEEEEDGTSRKNAAPQPTQKRAIKLSEIGPRMRLRLYKVEEGLCAGKTLWHEVVTKTSREEKAQEQVWEKRNAEKEERRRIQKENIERKRSEKAQASAKQKPGGNAMGAEVDEDDEDDDEEMGEDGWDDLEDEDMDELAAEAGSEEDDDE